MRSLKEEYLLVQSLSKGEKRQVTMIGRAKSGTVESAHLRLFEWLASRKDYQQEEAEATPFLQELGSGLPTVARRMQSLVMTTLAGMHNSQSQMTQIDLACFEGRLLVQRRLYKLATPVIRRGIEGALRLGQYGKATTLLNTRRTLVLASQEPDTMDLLIELAQQQRNYRKFENVQQELQHLQALALTLHLKGVAGRSPDHQQTWSGIMEEAEALAAMAGPDLLSRSLVADLQGQNLVAKGLGTEALPIYTPLVREWGNHENWIKEFPEVYIAFFRNYQRSIYFGTWDEEVLATYLELLPPISALPEVIRLDFQRINFSHQLTIGLNQARFEMLPALCENIIAWLDDNSRGLKEAVRMAFHYNIAIAHFLSGNFRASNQQTQVLLNWKRGPDRQDIRHFVRVLEVILLYELGEVDLNSYVERRSRRYLRQQPFQMAFETSVLKYVRELQSDNSSPLSARTQLAAQLSDLIEKTSRPTPMLGLFEVQIWLESQANGLPISETFRNYLKRMRRKG